MIEDACKVRQGNRTGHQIITVATMAGASHLVVDPKRRRPGAVSRINERASKNDREAALGIYKRYAETVAVDPVRLVDIGQGAVPADRGQVQFDALLFCVHRC